MWSTSLLGFTSQKKYVYILFNHHIRKYCKIKENNAKLMKHAKGNYLINIGYTG